MTERPIIVIGAGGHSKVVIEVLKKLSATILGVTEADPDRHGGDVLGVPILGGDEIILDHDPDAVMLVNGIGSIGDAKVRRDVFERLRKKGYRFSGLVHPSAVVAGDVELGDGAQVMAGAVIQPGCRIGANTIVNTSATVDHDCIIGDHVHIAPGALLGGGVTVGNSAHVGPGSIVVQKLVLGDGCLIAAGATVICSVAAATRVAGVPAKEMSDA
jgi:UDP-perosamine 4-acetyltransferase